MCVLTEDIVQLPSVTPPQHSQTQSPSTANTINSSQLQMSMNAMYQSPSLTNTSPSPSTIHYGQSQSSSPGHAPQSFSPAGGPNGNYQSPSAANVVHQSHLAGNDIRSQSATAMHTNQSSWPMNVMSPQSQSQSPYGMHAVQQSQSPLGMSAEQYQHATASLNAVAPQTDTFETHVASPAIKLPSATNARAIPSPGSNRASSATPVVLPARSRPLFSCQQWVNRRKEFMQSGTCRQLWRK